MVVSHFGDLSFDSPSQNSPGCSHNHYFRFNTFFCGSLQFSDGPLYQHIMLLLTNDLSVKPTLKVTGFVLVCVCPFHGG